MVAQPAELHALFNEVALSLALRVVAVDVILDEAVAIFATGSFCRLAWHNFLFCMIMQNLLNIDYIENRISQAIGKTYLIRT